MRDTKHDDGALFLLQCEFADVRYTMKNVIVADEGTIRRTSGVLVREDLIYELI